MSTTIRILVVVLVLTVPALGHAGTRVLGVEIGITSTGQLKQDLPNGVQLADSGVNKYTGGPMLKTDGAGFDIEGLTEVLFIFDDQDKLAAVLMTLGKSKFDSLFEILDGKYKVTAQQRPFVGNQFARFAATDAVIELDAPHMSFVMEARYIRNDLMKKFQAQTQAEEEARKKSEAAKF